MLLSIDANRYRREAEKCRRSAASAADREVREQWLLLAAEYDALVGSADALSVTRRARREEGDGSSPY